MTKMKKTNKKGLLWFLLLTFCSTYLVEFVLFLKGYTFTGVPALIGQLVVAGVMFFPGISAFIVRKWITKEGFKDAGLKIGKFKYYFQVYIIIPVIFIIVYGLTWIFIQQPDFTLNSFVKEYGTPKLPLPALQMIAAIFISTITFSPFLNSTAAFGEEFGWRGYLLPKLMPLGTNKALIISGIIWGLWHAPLVLMGFHYGQHIFLGVIFFTILVMLLGIYIGYLRLASGSVIVAAFAHGVFNAQGYGIWTVIFPTINPLIGGIFGLVGIAVFTIFCLYILQVLKNSKLQI